MPDTVVIGVTNPPTTIVPPKAPLRILGGSVLVFPYYTSSADGVSINTRIRLKCNNQVKVHGHIIVGSDGTVADFFVGLMENEETQITLTVLDPGGTGYLIFVASGDDGSPIVQNGLEGWIDIKTSDSSWSTFPAYAINGITIGAGGTLTFNNVEYDKVPSKVSISGFRGQPERDAIKFALCRIDGNLTGAGLGAIGLVTISQVDDHATQTWTKNITTPQFFGNLAALSMPGTVIVPTNTNTKITIEAPAGVAIVGAVHNFQNEWGDIGGRNSGGSLMVVETFRATADLIEAIFPPQAIINRTVDKLIYTNPVYNDSGRQQTYTAGVNLSSFEIGYFSNDSKLYLAKADSINTMLGLVLAVNTLPGEVGVGLSKGFITNGAWTWALNAPIYVSDITAGLLTQTLPVGANHIVQIVAWPVSATMIYFNPSIDYITL